MKRFDILFYILLFLGLVIGASQFFNPASGPTYQFTIIVATVTYYLIWGLAYHYLKRDLKRSLFLEYLTLGAIGIVVGILVFLS